MNSFYTTLLAAICCMYLQEVVSGTDENSFAQSNNLSNVNRAKRYAMNSYGESPIVLNHLLKQPILSFGPWFAPSRSKRFNSESLDYSDLNAFYPQPISQRRLRRALRQHKRVVLNI